MAESCQEILDLACQRPIPHGRGLPACQGSGSGITTQLTVCVFNRTRESFLCLGAAAGGALRSPLLAPEDGLWLAKSEKVWVVGDAFPVDLVYLDRGNRVIDLIEHLDPLRIVPRRWRYTSVLAARAQTIYSSGTRLGDELLICPPEELRGHWTSELRELAICLPEQE